MKSSKALTRKILCGLLAAGVVGVSGSALAANPIYSDYTSSENIDIDGSKLKVTYGENGPANFGVLGLNKNVINITGNDIGINTTANNNNAGVGIDAMRSSVITIGNDNTNTKIDVKSANWVIGIRAAGTDKDTKGSEVTINGKSLIVNTESTGDNTVYGIIAQNFTTDAPENLRAKLIINAGNTYINAKAASYGNADGIVAMSQGIMNINSNLEVHADNAIVARGDAIVKINEDGKHTTKLDGDMSFNYDKATSGTKVDADVLVNLTGSESYWNGNSKVTWGTGAIPAGLEKVTGIDLRINDGATWNPTYVEAADQGDYGTAVLAQNRVTLDGGNIDLTNAKNQQVKIETLAGDNGTIKIGSEDNSLAVTKGNTATNLTVAATQEYAEKIASNDMSGAVNDLAAKVKDETNADSSKTAASSVYIPETTVAGAVTADIDKDGKATNVKEAVNTTNAAVSDLASISLMTWRQENNDMNKRLGELRDSKGEHGAWARMARGESKYGAQMQTMMPKLHSSNFEGMELIRPLYLIREDDIKAWRDANGLHFIQCACKFTDTCSSCDKDGQSNSKRLEIKKLIRELKKTNPFVEGNIFKSVENVNLSTVIAYKKDGVKHHFLENYDSIGKNAPKAEDEAKE